MLTEFIAENDLLILFGLITGMGALAVIIIELINFLPSLMVSILNRMRNKTLANEPDSLTLNSSFDNVLEPKLESTLGTTKTLNENDLYKRFKKQ